MNRYDRKNDLTGYNRVHARVRRDRGTAKRHLCDCGNQAYDWASIKNTCMDNPDNYKPMCKKCHRRYDGFVEENHHSAKLDREDVKEIRILLNDGFTQAEIAAFFGVNKSTVRDIKTRKIWKHVA